jgi:hypothetical protein
MEVLAGHTYYPTTTDAPAGLVGVMTLGLKWPNGSTSQAVSTAGIVEVAPGSYVGTRVAPLVAGDYVIVWEVNDGDPDTPESVIDDLVVKVYDATGFATLDELAVRLGKESAEDFTAAEAAQGTLLIALATGIITDEVGKDAEWAAALDPVPATLRGVCLEMVARVMTNPTGARSESETLGQYQHSASYTDGAHGLAFDDAWSMMCRRVVYGRLSGSSTPATTLDRVIEYAETGDITT